MEGLLGAVFSLIGVYLGYRGALAIESKKARTRKEFLLAALRDELLRISGTMQDYRVEKAFIQAPIPRVTLRRLLDGDTLSYSGDAELISSLINLHVAISNYNNVVHIANVAQSVAPIPDNTHRQMYQSVEHHHELLLQAKADALRKIPGR